MKTDELIERICNIKYTRGSEEFRLVYDFSHEPKRQIENCVREWGYEIDKEIAKLEAKVYAYESIIRNSNFKGVLAEKEQGE